MSRQSPTKPPKRRRYVPITYRGYGKLWQKRKIYYVGARPKILRPDGAFKPGKTILETLAATFKRFELILCNGKSRVRKKGSTWQVFLSLDDVKEMKSRLFSRTKDATQSVVSARFSEIFPDHFEEGTRLFSYENDLFAGILTPTFAPTRLSKDDRVAFDNYIPRFVASGVGKSSAAGKFTAGIELNVLQPLAKELETRINNDRSETTWQSYLRQNITLIQQGYIELIPKSNIDVMGTAFPDFLLVTYDGYLDILEIKTPFTGLLLEDKSHNNYYWSSEISKAIAQVENYIQAVIDIGDKIRNKVKDRFGINLRVIKPRGIIFAGNSNQFGGDKLIQDDFRLLNEGLKNVTVTTYDELLTRLQNYIAALSGNTDSKAGSRRN